MPKTHNTTGFTLVEMIIYLAIIGTIMISVATFALGLLDVRAKSNTLSSVAFNAFLIQERLEEAVRHAEAINVGSSTFDTDPGVLSLDMVDAGLDPTVFSLTQDDGAFQIDEGGAGNVLVTANDVAVTNLTFHNLTSTEDIGIIRVEFSVTATGESGGPLYQYEEDFRTTLRIPLDD